MQLEPTTRSFDARARTAPLSQSATANAAAVPNSPAARPIAVRTAPLIASEWDLMRVFLRRTHRDDLRRRSGHPFDKDDEATARRFVDIKAGTGELSWMLDDAAAIAGVAHRIAISPTEAEVALLVRSDCHRRGIGEFLVRALLARAARQRLQTLCAVVQRDNRAILRFAEKIGYTCRAQTSWTLELIFDVAAFSQSNR
jgi:GNAT superfamily N-acetyltransferase